MTDSKSQTTSYSAIINRARAIKRAVGRDVSIANEVSRERGYGVLFDKRQHPDWKMAEAMEDRAVEIVTNGQ